MRETSSDARFGAVAALILIAALVPGPSRGQPETAAPASPLAAEQTFQFDMDAQPLTSELDRFSRTTGMQLFYDSALTAGRRGAAVHGRYTAPEGLLILLQGTQLRPRLTASDGVTLAPVGPLAAAGAAAGSEAAAPAGRQIKLGPLRIEAPPDFVAQQSYLFYAAAVRLQVRDALQKDGNVLQRRYRVQLSIWLDDEGHVLRNEMHRSSGDRALDAEVGRVLSHMTVTPVPPSGLPQPVHIDIVVDA